MASIFVINVPAHGHINPTLPWVRALVERGHRVTYYATPRHQAKIEQSGAAFRSYDAALDQMELPNNLFALTNLLIQLTEQLLPMLLDDVQRDRPDLIVHDSLATWGRAVAQLAGVPAVNSTSTFALNERVIARSPRFLTQFGAMVIPGLAHLARRIRVARRLRQRYGLRSLGFRDLVSNVGQLNLVYTARSFQPCGNTFGQGWQFVGPSLPTFVEVELPLIRNEQPLVYISLGTIFNNQLAFFQNCLRAFADAPVQVLLAVGQQIDLAALGRVPSNITVQRFVPQLAVLRQAALFITHGGVNSVHEGLCAGVPLLVFPQTPEQVLVAEQVAAVGAGRILTPRDTAPARLRTHAQAVMTPAYHTAAQRVGDELRRAGGYQRAADLIEASLPARSSGPTSVAIISTTSATV
ncbi:MAG: hypothetical protein H7Z42_06725 [Roseiflexaceae bacterium]|nr:hypothetical protein [Roseiflexaceae bacterium]